MSWKTKKKVEEEEEDEEARGAEGDDANDVINKSPAPVVESLCPSRLCHLNHLRRCE